MRIGIDLIGSDCAPLILFRAVIQSIEDSPFVNFTLFATQHVIDEIILEFSAFLSINQSRLHFEAVNETIEMHEEPLAAFSKKKQSSIVKGYQFLKEHLIDAFISAGNTGALVAGASLTFSLLEGITRPALLTLLPTEKKAVAVLDVGGNVTYKAFHLVQFAQLGASHQQIQNAIAVPRIGLLNIGSESKKGTLELQRAYQLLKNANAHLQFEFIGNVEGRDVFQGDVDVLITDGFTGNILLKASEGVYHFILQKLQLLLQDLPIEQQQYVYENLKKQFDYEEQSGAIITGIDRIVIKCHGKFSYKGLFKAINGAIQLVDANYIDAMIQQLSHYSGK